MAAYLARKIALAALTVLVTSIIVFAMLEVVPGDPARIMLGINATADAVAALRERLGLDLPVWQRYFAWIGGVATGDLGTSYAYGQPVAGLIADRLAVSLPLALLALALSTVIAIPVGVIAARMRSRLPDTAVMGATQVGIALPNFWLALLLVWLFAIVLRIVPAGGFPGWSDPLAALTALALPTVALAVPQGAILSRLVRSAMIDTMDEDYIRTARAKGVSRSGALWRHALRNAMIPIVTIMGLQFAYLLSGTIIIENVFYLPGLGRLVFQAIERRDLIVVESVVLVLVLVVVAINLLVDFAYAVIDPRLRRAA